MSILIVNNDPVFLAELQKSFEKQGFDVITAHNSLLALQYFFLHKPQAIILDVFMTDKDGFEMIQEIRTFCQKTFILAVSGNDLYLKAIKKLGADEALPKWVQTDSIVDFFEKNSANSKY